MNKGHHIQMEILRYKKGSQRPKRQSVFNTGYYKHAIGRDTRCIEGKKPTSGRSVFTYSINGFGEGIHNLLNERLE
jgi:hypothetical protein